MPAIRKQAELVTLAYTPDQFSEQVRKHPHFDEFWATVETGDTDLDLYFSTYEKITGNKTRLTIDQVMMMCLNDNDGETGLTKDSPVPQQQHVVGLMQAIETAVAS